MPSDAEERHVNCYGNGAKLHSAVFDLSMKKEIMYVRDILFYDGKPLQGIFGSASVLCR